MQNRSVMKSFTDDRVTAQVTLGHLIGPAHQQIEGEAGWAGLSHCADLLSEQDDLLRGKPLHQLLREGPQCRLNA